MGLFDRNYMRPSPAFTPRRNGDDMLWTLIGINVAVFLVSLANPQFAEKLVLTTGGIREFRIYQLVSAAFLHFDIWHLLLNLWGLYLFGKLVTPFLDKWRILWLYLVSAVAGNLLFLVFNWQVPTGLLGASGAVFGVTIAAALVQPDREFVLIFLPFWPLKTKTMVICYTILEILSQLGGNDGVAHLAHLGGFLGGYLYMKLFSGCPLAWDPFRGRPRIRPETAWRQPDWTRDPGYGSAPDAGDRPVTQKELDYLLDKVSNQGINSLSDYEMARLRRAREQMRGSGR